MGDVNTSKEVLILEKPTDSFLLTSESVVNHDISRAEIIKNATKSLDQGIQLSLESVKALWQRAYHDLSLSAEPTVKIFGQGESKTFPQGLSDDMLGGGDERKNERNGMAEITFAAAKRLTDSEKVDFTKYLLESNLRKSSAVIERMDFGLIFSDFLDSAKNKPQLIQTILDFIYENNNLFPGNFFDFPRELLTILTIYEHRACLEVLAQEENESKTRSLLGKIISIETCSTKFYFGNYFETLNLVRQISEESDNKPDYKEKVDRLGKMLLGLDPNNLSLPFHDSLESVYHALDFERYPPNVAVNENEVQQIIRVAMRAPKGPVLDLACGTGRIANALAEKGLKTIGIDNLLVQLEKAKAADSTGIVEYKLADWHKLPLKDKSISVVVLLGRSLCHTKDRLDLEEVFREIKRVLKPGGIILFDLPDPHEGQYLQNRKNLQNVLIQFGVPEKKVLLDQIEYVADSADGTNFYSRYIPLQETIQAISDRLKLNTRMVSRIPIPKSEGDFNCYFEAIPS